MAQFVAEDKLNQDKKEEAFMYLERRGSPVKFVTYFRKFLMNRLGSINRRRWCINYAKNASSFVHRIKPLDFEEWEITEENLDLDWFPGSFVSGARVDLMDSVLYIYRQLKKLPLRQGYRRDLAEFFLAIVEMIMLSGVPERKMVNALAEKFKVSRTSINVWLHELSYCEVMEELR
jgi:hypothetical protein